MVHHKVYFSGVPYITLQTQTSTVKNSGTDGSPSVKIVGSQNNVTIEKLNNAGQNDLWSGK